MDSIRRALGIVREGDPGAWLCGFCNRWTTRNECPNHRVRIFREPTTPRPAFVAPPPRPLVDAKGPVVPKPSMPDRWIG